MSEYLLIALIVAGIAGFMFWNSRKTQPVPESAPVSVNTPAPVAAPVAAQGETGVAKYLRTLPPPPVETGVAKYLKGLPKPAPETGVARYLKTLKEPAKPETGVSRYISAVAGSQVARSAEATLEALVAGIPAPTRETGVARYLKAVHGH